MSANEIQRQAHMSIVGRAMFCKCGNVLDYRRAVDLTVETVPEGKILRTMVLCAPCSDRLGWTGDGATQADRDRAVSNAVNMPARLVVTDGRQWGNR